jgi:hypothetical protein
VRLGFENVREITTGDSPPQAGSGARLVISGPTQ